MHETIEAIQVAVTVWTTVGVGGYAVGALRGRRRHGTRSSRAVSQPANGNGADDSSDPSPISDVRHFAETARQPGVPFDRRSGKEREARRTGLEPGHRELAEDG